MPKQRLALSWGPSFAELETGSDWARVYTAQSSLPAILKNQSSSEAKEWRVSLSVMRRILDTRLGNSVAQIVTQGFEHWVGLRQTAEPGRFDLTPSRGEPLSNPDHIFPLPERISASGEILQELRTEDLDRIVAALKAKGIERVCVNLLFAHRNPIHQEKVRKHLQENGLQVFSRVRSPHSQDELSAWRRNLLDASLSSFFEKLRDELREAAGESEILFLDSEKGFVPADQVAPAALLFGRERSLQRKKPFLYFGPEEWCWILPRDQDLWKSSWGSVELRSPMMGFFSEQPGREILLTTEGRLRWGQDSGMDPGPMLWGRSSKISLLDVMDWHWETTPPLRRNEKTETKVREQLASLKKNSRDWSKNSTEQMRREVSLGLGESLLSDLASLGVGDDFEVGGVLAEAILPWLREARPKWHWNLIPAERSETLLFWEIPRA